jgi:elongation factor P--beta-lysine ligase
MQIKTQIENLERYKTYLQIKSITHEYLRKQGYLEMSVPILTPALIPESYLEVFETELIKGTEKSKLYLAPTPELFLKRVLAYGGLDCYYLGKSFRNGEKDSTMHSIEFMMLEFYKLQSDYDHIAEELLGLMRHICHILHKGPTMKYKNTDVNFSQWERISVAEAFNNHAGIGPDILFNVGAFMNKAKEKGYDVEGKTYEQIFEEISAKEVEPHQGNGGYPTLLYEYPKQVAPRAKINEDGITCQRFEFFIGGVELGDCYTEVNDPAEQKSRFEQEVQQRKEKGKIDVTVDDGFIQALEKGIEHCSGVSVGFDRLAMIFAGADTIHQMRVIEVV